MKRAILSGTLVWILIFTLFVILSFIPGTKDSELQQGIIIGIFIIPFATLGAAFYYKNGSKTHGLVAGMLMLLTALILDAAITVPFVEIPYKGSSYTKFFTSALLWILVVENILVIYLYWVFRVKSHESN